MEPSRRDVIAAFKLLVRSKAFRKLRSKSGPRRLLRELLRRRLEDQPRDAFNGEALAAELRWIHEQPQRRKGKRTGKRPEREDGWIKSTKANLEKKLALAYKEPNAPALEFEFLGNYPIWRWRVVQAPANA